MLTLSGQLHPRVQMLPSLRAFAPVVASAAGDKPRARRAHPLKAPTALSVDLGASPSSGEFLRSQLQKAVHFHDIDACIYLLKHQDPGAGLSLSRPELQELVSSAFHHRRPDQAVALLAALPAASPRHYSMLMRECIQRRDLAALDAVLAAREAAGFAPDAYTASAQITALGAARRPGDALAALHAAWERPDCRTVEVVNAGIGAAAAAGDWPAALAARRLLAAAGLAPDAVTYNSLIKAAGAAGLMPQVKGLFEEMVGSGVPPTHVTYTALFSAAARCECGDTPWLFKVFNDMALAPNDFVLSAFFSALAAAPCGRPHLDAVFTALAEARARGPLNDTVYTSLLKLITRQGEADRAVHVWRAALGDGAPLSPHLFSALFAACAAGQSPTLVDVALDAYDELREWWAAQDKARVPRWVERDVQWAHNSLLHFIGAEGRLDEAMAVFEGMKREGPLPDGVTYNTLIAAAGRAGDPQAASQLFGEMANAGVAPSERTFGALLHAFAAVGDAAGAAGVLSSLAAAGIEPNAVIYTSFIHALVTSGRPGDLEAAFEAAAEMRARGLPPTAVTYGCLLTACDRLGDTPRALRLYQRACDEGVTPSDAMHDILLGICARGGRLDEALDLVKAMARTHAQMQQHTMDSLVRALAGASPGRALRMLGLMQARGAAPSHPTYLALIASCARASDGAEALTLYRSMRAQGMEIDGAAGSALICCLSASQAEQDLAAAVGVYRDMLLAAWRRENPGAPPGVSGRRFGGGGVRRGALPRRAAAPDAAALASLSQAFAARGDLRQGWRFYSQLRRAPGGLQEACVTHRRLFESLIEQHCRAGAVARALVVFDDWKAASAAWFAKASAREASAAAAAAAAAEASAAGGTLAPPQSPPPPAGAKGRRPKLSTVSLAFLEACCQTTPGLAWRVYDVCSVMRTQKDRKVQEGLARPQKASHHVAGQAA